MTLVYSCPQVAKMYPAVMHLPFHNSVSASLSSSSAAVPAGVDLAGERPGGGEAPRAAGGGDGPPLQLPRRLHPGGQKHQPLH